MLDSASTRLLAGSPHLAYDEPMYVLDPAAGKRWFSALRPHLTKWVVSILPKTREADDGSQELWAEVVLVDLVMQISHAERRTILLAIESELRRTMLEGGNYFSVGERPFVSFLTEGEVSRLQRERAG